MELVPKPLLDGVIRVFNPVQVILFGSRARGDHREDSDIDLYVVVDDDAPRERVSGEKRYAARNGYRGALDMLIARASVFEKRKKWLNVFERDVADDGIVLYSRDR